MNGLYTKFCTALLFVCVPTLLAIRFTWPRRVPWWVIVVATGALGWVFASLIVYFSHAYAADLIEQAGGFQHAPPGLIAAWERDGGPKTFASLLGWIPTLLLLIPPLVAYGIAHRLRRSSDRADSAVAKVDHVSKAPMIWAFGVYCAVIASLLWINADPGPADVRARNDTGIVLHDVSIESVRYGDMAPGSVTGYTKLPHARKYPIFSLIVGNTVMGGGLGDPPSKVLGAGRFTYVIALTVPGKIPHGPFDFDVHAERE